MKDKTIYLVIRAEGVFPDFTQNFVKAYYDEDKAIDHAKRAELRNKELGEKNSQTKQDYINEFDPGHIVNYFRRNNIYFYIDEVILCEDK